MIIDDQPNVWHFSYARDVIIEYLASGNGHRALSILICVIKFNNGHMANDRIDNNKVASL